MAEVSFKTSSLNESLDILEAIKSQYPEVYYDCGGNSILTNVLNAYLISKTEVGLQSEVLSEDKLKEIFEQFND